jgi:protein CpxP
MICEDTRMSKYRAVAALRGMPVTAVALALAAGAALVGSAEVSTAQAADQSDTRSAAASPASSTTQQSDERAGVDALIDHLHDRLKITADQERLWSAVTVVMRENAATMSALARERAAQLQTATALDNLESYTELSEAHATGMRRMVPVFQALYDRFSPEQRKAADAEFRGRLQERAQRPD